MRVFGFLARLSLPLDPEDNLASLVQGVEKKALVRRAGGGVDDLARENRARLKTARGRTDPVAADAWERC